MTKSDSSATFSLGSRVVNRSGYSAMQLAGPGVFGPPKDRDAALAVLRETVASGVNHIDTSDFYGPHVTNQLIREALAPYPDELVIVTKVGARRGDDASWIPAFSREELTRAVHDNLRNLGLEALDVVNLRSMHGPSWTRRRVDRGTARRAGRAPAARPGAPYRAEQCHTGADRGSARDLRDRLRAEPLQSSATRQRSAD
jgi:aryl-alcohol dehydrogenase-like predicted oxidoreductase